jgi:hypothetical protein
VTAAAAVGDSHTKYVDGLRFTSKYQYKTNVYTTDFIEKERNTTIHREVRFTCSDGSRVDYRFEFSIQSTDVERVNKYFH